MVVRKAAVIGLVCALTAACSKVKRDGQDKTGEVVPTTAKEQVKLAPPPAKSALDLMGYLPTETRVITTLHLPSLAQSKLFGPMRQKLLGGDAAAFATIQKLCELGEDFGRARFVVIGSTKIEGKDPGAALVIQGGPSGDVLAGCVARAKAEHGFRFELVPVGARRMALIGAGDRAAAEIAAGVLIVGPRAWVERWLSAPPVRGSGPPTELLAVLVKGFHPEQPLSMAATELTTTSPGLGQVGFTSFTMAVGLEAGKVTLDLRATANSPSVAESLAKSINDVGKGNPTFFNMAAEAKGDSFVLTASSDEGQAAGMLGVMLP